MATFNHKIEVSNGSTTDTFHPETNVGQVYDFNNEKWLSEIIGLLSMLTSSQKNSLVEAINSVQSDAAREASVLNDAIMNHTSNVATPTQLGHVRPDGRSIVIDDVGVISAVGGSVSSVNGVLPDANGNVSLSLASIGAASETELKNLLRMVEQLTEEVNKHLEQIASETQFGHVRVDGTSIKVNDSGVISAVGGSSGGGLGGNTVVLTQDQYDNLSNEEKALDVFYFIKE